MITEATRQDPQALASLHLWQLVSPALPIGAYHFSQGLEYAVHAGWVQDEDGALDWIAGLADAALGTLDLPLLWRLQQAWQRDDEAAVLRWSQRLLAARESAEQRAEERHLGRALAKALHTLGIDAAAHWITHPAATQAGLFALAAARWSIPARDAARGYLWGWCENQVLAALKLLPVGQSAGLRLQAALLPQLPDIVARAFELDDAEIGVAAPLQAMACAWHETQYTRLFRS